MTRICVVKKTHKHAIDCFPLRRLYARVGVAVAQEYGVEKSMESKANAGPATARLIGIL
jgi:hypothetical protein